MFPGLKLTVYHEWNLKTLLQFNPVCIFLHRNLLEHWIAFQIQRRKWWLLVGYARMMSCTMIKGMLRRLMCCCSHISLSTPRPLTLVATCESRKMGKHVSFLNLTAKENYKIHIVQINSLTLRCHNMLAARGIPTTRLVMQTDEIAILGRSKFLKWFFLL